LNTSFERLAQKVNTTQTNLMNDILNEYLNWSQFMVNHESPFLTFGSRTAVALIESVEDAALEKIIKEISNVFTSSIPSVEARCEVSNISCFVYLKMQPAR
jgi:hypothetical protein